MQIDVQSAGRRRLAARRWRTLRWVPVALGLAACDSASTPPPASPPSPVRWTMVPSEPDGSEGETPGSKGKSRPARRAKDAPAEETYPGEPTAQLPLGPAEIRLLAAALPLREDSVRLDASERFLTMYLPYAKNSTLVRRAQTRIRELRGLLDAPRSSISLARSADGVLGGWSPSAAAYGAYVLALEATVTASADVIRDFYEQVRDQEHLPEGSLRQIQQQIGAEWGSIEQRNVSSLQGELNRVMKSNK